MLKDIRTNPIMLTDGYNLSHPFLKINTDWEVSHMYNRTGEYGGMYLFGFSEIVNSILSVQITMDMVDEAEKHAVEMGMMFPRKLWENVVNECNGYLPLQIDCLPEGTWCPNGTPFAQIMNTKEGYGEMVTWLEGVFMMAYFPSACATEAMMMRKYLEMRKEQFGYTDSFLNRFHSFGFRGHRSLEDAYWASKAWNLALFGTDDFHSKLHTSASVGTIPALAHKVTQQYDKEYDCFKRAIDVAETTTKIIALVIDTYDANRFIKEYLIPLAKYAEKRDVHIVCRPDSGDTWQQTLEIYKVVRKNSFNNVTVIIGEGMSFTNAKKCDEFLLENGVPLNFVSYGIGGGFYNHINRDTHGWAMKTAYSNGKPRMKFSMDSMKRSIPGDVNLVKRGNDMFVCPHSSVDLGDTLYVTIYHNGDSYIYPWSDVQNRIFDQNIAQKRIYLSEEINDLIASFERQYK